MNMKIAIIALFALIIGIIGLTGYLNSQILEIKIKLIKMEGKNAKTENLIQTTVEKLAEAQFEIQNMKTELKRLECCHAIKHSVELVMTKRGEELEYGEVCRFSHNKEKYDTENIKDVTLEELTKYVIDGKPIIREKMVKKEYKPQCGKK